MDFKIDKNEIIGAIVIGFCLVLLILLTGGGNKKDNEKFAKNVNTIFQLKNELLMDSIYFNTDKKPAVKYHYAELDSISNYYKKLSADKITTIGEIRIAEFKENNYKFFHLNRKGKNEIYTFFRPIKMDSSTQNILNGFYQNEPAFKSADKFLTK